MEFHLRVQHTPYTNQLSDRTSRAVRGVNVWVKRDDALVQHIHYSEKYKCFVIIHNNMEFFVYRIVHRIVF